MTQNKKLERQPLDYYLSLKYPISIYPEDEGYTVMIPDLPGCISQGESSEEAISSINEARELWIETVYQSAKKATPFPSKRI
jgi:antitoxin HicB